MKIHIAREIFSSVFTTALLLLVATASPLIAAPDPSTPTLADVSYGPHERNVLDLWKADSDRPTPLVVFIHGGGFSRGDKSSIRGKPAVKQCLDTGVSFATINYRFRETAPIQDILRDAARAIQTIRSRATEWNIDPARIASYGGSAGAGTSLWLAFHDDLADSNSADPVLRQSTRLTAAGSLNGQASYDLRDWRNVVGPSEFERGAPELMVFYGLRSESELATPAADKVMKDCSMISLITADDPPVAVACGFADGPIADRGHYLHHPKHSTALADRCKAAGVPCLLLLRADRPDDNARQDAAVVAFLIEKVKEH